jgi:alanine racemase
MREAVLRIDRAALRHNLQRVRDCMPGARVLAMVKADAYGHGAVEAALALQGADGFGVALLQEAEALRNAGITHPVTLLEGVFTAAEMQAVVLHGLTTIVHQSSQVDLLRAVPADRPVDVWLKLDTGMHRLGFAVEQAAAVYRTLRALPGVRSVGLLTHFARADEPAFSHTHEQIERFRALQRQLEAETGESIPDSLANSAGILAWPAAAGSWVRPGIMLYGGSPFADRTADVLGLRPVMTLSSRLIAIRELKAGEAVGYGGTWVAPRDTRIGVVAIGYGDGYPRHAANGTPVLVNGVRVPLAGRVSMDMITVDLGDAPATIGDACTLWGEGLSADEVAAAAGTISYELFCKVTARVQRVLS